jgi:hypothetical protein
MSDDTLIDAALVRDPDLLQEMGAAPSAIADSDIKGCRLLIVRRGIEPIEAAGEPGGLIELAVSFQPTDRVRFTWAQIVIVLAKPEGTIFVDLAPTTTMNGEIKYAVETSGKLSASFKPAGIDASHGTKVTAKFVSSHCGVHGTGAGTTKARWEFTEDPQRQEGLGHEQTLLATVGRTGHIRGNVSVYAKIVRPGLLGDVDRATYLVLGPDEHHAGLILDIPGV